MIQINDISLAFGQQIIFDAISCNISPDQKIGLVGPNGAGKTTLLNAIAGKQHLDEGQIRMPKSFKCAFMPQDVVLVSQKTIINEVLNVYPDLAQFVDKLTAIDHLIAKKEATDKQLEEYAEINHHLYEMDYENKRAEAEKILMGLGFKQDQLQNSVETLSVGWKMRLVLASLLLQKADFYLFDEPTNHLDLFAKDWFVEFLKTAPFGFLLVSHDEYFLNEVCENIWAISLGKLKMYHGNYKSYLIKKEEDEALLEKKYEEQQKIIKKKQETIERFRYKASKAKMAQSMIKSLEKVEKIQLEHKQKNVCFRLPEVKQSGKVVIDVKNLGFSFGEKKIFDNATFQVLRGHKVAIVAPNGTGKSTLLNVITGKYRQKNGTFSFGHDVMPVFFQQDQNKSLNLNNRIIEEVESVCETSEERAHVRTLLGAFLFSGEDVNKKVAVLSGGEKNRVAMVKILLKKANLLILDEPTNHLDIASKNVLLDVLSKFKGTIVFVSHDRTFLNNLATDILDLTPQSTHSYVGNYDDYLYHKKHVDSFAAFDENEKIEKNRKAKKTLSNPHELHKQIKKIENLIKKLEKKIATLEEAFVDLLYGTPEYIKAINELQKNKKELENQYQAWALRQAQDERNRS